MDRPVKLGNLVALGVRRGLGLSFVASKGINIKCNAVGLDFFEYTRLSCVTPSKR